MTLPTGTPDAMPASNQRQPTVDTDQGVSPSPGPPYTILDVARLQTGAVLVKVRIRGGRKLRLYVPVGVANGPDIVDLIAVVLSVETERRTHG